MTRFGYFVPGPKCGQRISASVGPPAVPLESVRYVGFPDGTGIIVDHEADKGVR
jgi:hypothetical protein